MLDNAYVHLGATRMTLFRSKTDWALVIEIFGYCYKAKLPDLSIYTFASTLYKRDTLDDYVTEAAYHRYLAETPHNEFRLFCPVKHVTGWDPENPESVADTGGYVHLRDTQLPLPSPAVYAQLGIPLKSQGPDMVALSRYLAGTHAAAGCLASPRFGSGRTSRRHGDVPASGPGSRFWGYLSLPAHGRREHALEAWDPMTAESNLAWIKRLPKIELHLHLEGAIPYDALWTRMQKYGEDAEVLSKEQLKRRFAYRDFAHFIETWVWKNQFLREYEDFTFIAEAVARDLADQHIRYAVASYEAHPVRRYYERGIAISINTDDPKMFGNSLAEEYRLLIEEKGFTPAEIKEVILESIEMAWMSENSKQQLVKVFREDPGWLE